MSIAIFAFNEKTFLELINGAKILKQSTNKEICPIIIGLDVASLAGKVASSGVDKVYLIENEALRFFNPETYSRVLKTIVEEINADIVLLESNNKGKILAGILGSKLNAGVVVDALEITIENGYLIAKKAVYAGKALSTLKITSQKKVIAVASGVFEPAEIGESKAEIVKKDVDVAEIKTKLLEFKPKAVSEVSLEDAEVVIGAGRGIRKQEDLEPIKEIAKILGGAWGVTRPLAADYGWAPEWIGISGVSIKPKLYIAVGISGQPQHTSGIRGSKIIVAINKDSEAPIFKYSDYGIIGDAYQIIPELIKRLKEIKGV